jgi:uncharacterized protein YndB with AHSA1/START domain
VEWGVRAILRGYELRRCKSKMRWPLSTPVMFETALAPKEVQARLKAAVLPGHARRGGFLDAATEGDFPVEGWVRAGSCRLQYHGSYRRGGGRCLYLLFEPQGTGTKLHGEFRFGLDAVAPLLAFAVFVLWRIWNGTGRGAGLEVAVLCGAFVLMFGFVAESAQMYWTRRDEQFVLTFVEGVLQESAEGGSAAVELHGKMFPVQESARPGRVDVRLSQEFSRKPSEVYRAFLNPNLARQFLFATEAGTIVRTEINARIGGEFTFVDRRDGVDVLHTGHYVQLDPGSCIAFDFKVPMYSDASSTVTLEFLPMWQGCNVMLTCEGVLPAWGEATRDGWSAILRKAAAVLTEQSGIAVAA